ncbi:MAG: VPS10 domain-containing protein, partial [Crocinitomicaceae bacterium]
YVNPGNNRKTYFSDIAGKILPTNLNDPIANTAFGMAPNESYWAAESSEMEFHPNCYSIAYVGKDNSIWKTTDAGASFNMLYSFGTNTANQIKYIEISSSNPSVIYLNQQPSSGSNGTLWKTTDGGVTWSQLNKPSGNSRRMLLSLNPQNENELWIAYPDGSNGFKVYKTTNSGQSWENWTSSIFNNESVQALNYIAGTDGGVYIATDRAVYYRNNQGQFQLDNSGLPLFTSGNIIKPFYRDGKIRLATYGKGIWESNLSEQPTYPIARAMVDKLSHEIICEIDSFYFEDHSFLNHTNATWNWTFPTGSPSNSTERNPSVLFTQAGSHQAILEITDGNGNSDSDTIEINVNYLSLPTSISEGFEGTFVTSGWSINNPNNDAQWSLSSSAGGYGNSSKSAIFDNYNNDSQGNSDDLIMNFNPSVIAANSNLKFDVAYARWGSGYSDTLEVLASTDCGQTFQSLYMKGGTDLATSPDFQDYFTPNSS